MVPGPASPLRVQAILAAAPGKQREKPLCLSDLILSSSLTHRACFPQCLAWPHGVGRWVLL